MQERKAPLLILAGPTAVGKSELSLRLARELSGECISADSMQVYRTLDIGTAKMTEAERQGVRHHLIDVIAPEENYDVKEFQHMGRQAVRETLQNGHLPILVGGTGFYIQALLYGIDFTEERGDGEIREALEKAAETEAGRRGLYEKLQQTDPLSAERIHSRNIKRIIRALEFYEIHHMPISLHNDAEKKREACYDAQFFVLSDEREALYERINRRVDAMMAGGLLEEAERLYRSGIDRGATSMQGIGYRELFRYFDGACSLPEAVEAIKKNSRNYAKRQFTWFRREESAIWVHLPDFSYDKEKISSWITEKCMKHWGLTEASFGTASQSLTP